VYKSSEIIDDNICGRGGSREYKQNEPPRTAWRIMRRITNEREK
jgi:hypothetical protein